MARSSNRQQRSLRVEPLEDRRLLAVLYVDASSGNDSLGDGSANTPFATIQRGVDAARQLAGDDTVSIRPGNYPEEVMIDDLSGGITLSGMTGDPADVLVRGIRPLLQDGGVHLEALRVDTHVWPYGGAGDLSINNVSAQRLIVPSAGDVSVSDSQFEGMNFSSFEVLTVTNFDLVGDESTRGGIVASSGQQVVIDGARLDHGVFHAINVTNILGDVTIRDAAASHRGGHGIFLDTVGSVTIENVTANGNGLNDGDAGRGISINQAAHLTLRDVVASGNEKHGIHAQNLFVVTATNVAANDNAGTDSSGGALFMALGSVAIDGGEFSGNSHHGLEIPALGSYLNVEISGVDAENNGRMGLRVFSREGAVAIADGSFSNNAIRGVEVLSPAGATIRNLDILNNGNGALVAQPSEGGGLYIGTAHPLPILIEDVEIAGNDSLFQGAGLFVGTPGTATIRSSQIHGNTNAVGAARGGGIFAGNLSGTILLQDSLVANNSSVNGGGVWSSGGLVVERSSVAGNTALSTGGGILAAGGENVLVSQSTLSGNVAGSDGGGILLRGYAPHIVNSTISGNSSGANGGGVFVTSGQPLLEWSTIANNAAAANGGGVYVASSYVTARANIIAKNSAAYAPDAFGPFAATQTSPGGGNIVGDATGAMGFGATNLAGTSAYPIDPMIGPLQNNGGPTETHALLPGSPAIDLLDFGGPGFDQRGFLRGVDGDGDEDPYRVYDVGAFEYSNAAPAAHDDAASTDEDTEVTIDVLANDGDTNGDALTVTSVTPPTHGLASINSDGTISYTPDPDFFGSDGFSYTISDGNGGVASAEVQIAVHPINDYPEAVDAVFTIEENSPNGMEIGSVTASDVDGDALAFVLSGEDASAFTIDPSSGRLTVADSALLDFETRQQFEFTVSVSDGNGGQSSANVRVQLTDVLEVGIDVLPSNPDNLLSTKTSQIEIAILGGAGFDPHAMIDVSTVRLNVSGSTASVGAVSHSKHGFKVQQRDVDGDGVLDMVLLFDVSSLGLPLGSSNLQLSGNLLPESGGDSFAVEQAVTVIDGGGKGKDRGNRRGK